MLAAYSPDEPRSDVPEDQIIVRWIATDRLSSFEQHALDRLLVPEERLRASRFHFEENRRTFTAAHALTRSILSELTGRSPLSWTFRDGPHGKPEPVTQTGEPAIHMNLSHTKNLAVVAAAIGRELGVDAEWLGQPAPLDIAERYFTPPELDLIHANNEARKQETFFALWTLKEAYMKATGKGMHLPLDSFAFSLDPIRLLYSADDTGWARWKFAQTRIGQNHIAALAVDWPETSQMNVSLAPADLGRL